MPDNQTLQWTGPRVERSGKIETRPARCRPLNFGPFAATMPDDQFEKILAFLERLPAISLPAGRKSIGRGVFENGNWWLKFTLDTNHPLAWRHVQELGFVLNYVSLEERLPTVFMPVSPPPYMNGGVEFLSWVIESNDPSFTADLCAEWLEGRLPQPVDDQSRWATDGDIEDDDDG